MLLLFLILSNSSFSKPDINKIFDTAYADLKERVKDIDESIDFDFNMYGRYSDWTADKGLDKADIEENLPRFIDYVNQNPSYEELRVKFGSSSTELYKRVLAYLRDKKITFDQIDEKDIEKIKNS